MGKGAKLDRIGICIKTTDKVVLYQNSTCQRTCGNAQGKVCEMGCMADYARSRLGEIFDEGIRVKKNLKLDDGLIDAVIINDGEQITSFLYYKSRKLEAELAVFKQRKLSETETTIMEFVLQEYSNQTIAKKLHISISTLKTHLNNIYRKIPSELKKEIMRKRTDQPK